MPYSAPILTKWVLRLSAQAGSRTAAFTRGSGFFGRQQELPNVLPRCRMPVSVRCCIVFRADSELRSLHRVPTLSEGLFFWWYHHGFCREPFAPYLGPSCTVSGSSRVSSAEAAYTYRRCFQVCKCKGLSCLKRDPHRSSWFLWLMENQVPNEMTLKADGAPPEAFRGL